MKLLRLLANLGYGSRKQVRALFREGRVTDDEGRVLGIGDTCEHARVRVDGERLDPPQGMVIALHKPVGYTCSHDDHGPLVHDLLPERFRFRRPIVSSIGRLDRDTSGLLLLTDDGALLHRIISPRHHVAKVYLVRLEEDLRGDEKQRFENGDLALKHEKAPLLPARFEALDARTARVTLTEGRYHQVRRMFAACGHHVAALHRESVGGLDLDGLSLEPGEWGQLGPDQVERIFQSS
jgi:16S rRNA pseudouridine516 synthase